jgi:hypothetical protein
MSATARNAFGDDVWLIDLSEAALPAPIARCNQVIADAGRHNLANDGERENDGVIRGSEGLVLRHDTRLP